MHALFWIAQRVFAKELLCCHISTFRVYYKIILHVLVLSCISWVHNVTTLAYLGTFIVIPQELKVIETCRKCHVKPQNAAFIMESESYYIGFKICNCPNSRYKILIQDASFT